MRKTTGKSGNKTYQGIYTKSTMQNQKKRRERKADSSTQKADSNAPHSKDSRVTVDGWAIVFAIQTLAFVPTSMSWKIILALAFIVTGLKRIEK